jgi:Zn finger protein HypA/HybF involved in hydrogenase expression
MTVNYKKIKCPHCGKKFLATFGTSNYCPKCQAQTTIELGENYKCKSCLHKFRLPKKLADECPKCGSRKIITVVSPEYDFLVKPVDFILDSGFGFLKKKLKKKKNKKSKQTP